MDDIIIVLPMVVEDTTTIEDDTTTIDDDTMTIDDDTMTIVDDTMAIADDTMTIADDTMMIVEEMSDGGEVVAMIGEQSIEKEEVVPTREVPRPPPTKTMWTTASDIFPTTDRGHCWDRDTKL